MTDGRRRLWVFALLSALCFAAIAVLVVSAGRRGTSGEAGSTDSAMADGAYGRFERLYFRHTGLGPDYGRLRYMGPSQAESFVTVEHLACEAVHASRTRGLCLAANRGVITTYAARVFDASDHRVVADVALAGVPSRTRVSVDGRIGATTVFVTGHGYDSVDFSTQTLLLDLTDGSTIADLETFDVVWKGEPFRSEDFNYWGVTFTSDGRFFYATLSTNRRHLLVRGDIGARRVEVLHEGVECPSLSPDATRIAYKKRIVVGNRVTWRLAVLDIATLAETDLAEQRSVDDQLEWLDEDHVLYSVPASDGTASTDVWIARADGQGSPRLFLRNAYSPAVVR